MNTITLLDCGHLESPHSEFTRGYGKDAEGKTHCYECCAAMDKDQMRNDGKITLYLVRNVEITGKRDPQGVLHRKPTQGGYKVTNWPGSLSIPVSWISTGRHNIAGKRYDVWFWFEGFQWWGVQYGDNTQLCHCKQTKIARNSA